MLSLAKLFRYLYRNFLPVWLGLWVYYLTHPRNRIFLAERRQVIRLLQEKAAADPEIHEILRFVRRNKTLIFPYAFVKNYYPEDIPVYVDGDLFYTMYDGKRLYFPRGLKKKTIRECCSGLLLEQDKASPHRYETDTFGVQAGDIVAEVGAAEGNFGLSVVERAKKLYLFECE
ncbi:hypothetical protein NO2_1163, partial [Candidatus Termititenax persephonae]